MTTRPRLLPALLSLFAGLLPPLNAGDAAPTAAPAPSAVEGPAPSQVEGSAVSPSSPPASTQSQATAVAKAVSAAAEKPTMTLEECIAVALAHNFDIQLQSLVLASARESLAIAKAGFDPAISVNTVHNQNKAVNSSTTLEGTTSEGASGNLSLSKLLPATGATVTLSSTLFNERRTNNTFAVFNPEYNSSLAFSVSQPLLRAYGPAYNRAAILRSAIGLDRSGLDYKGRALDLVRDVENAYASLIAAREQLEVRRFSLQLAQQLFEENQARRNTGLLTDLDVLTAEVGVANARNAMLLSEQAVRDRADGLRNLIGLADLDTVLVPAALPEPPEAAPSVDRSYQLALANQTDYQSILAQLKQLELDVFTARSNRLPQLTFDGSLGYGGRSGTLGGAWDLVRERDSYNWQLGLSLRMPWGLHAENARYRTSLNNLQSTKIRIQQLERDLLVQIRSAVGTVQTSMESVRLSDFSAQLSARRYDLERARFAAGLST
ncbi:MAG: hypothetical protein A3G75_13215, partial [Verrucomicrobia bacterium RIFCSPLOWO2_12_FULL_64_8]